MNKQKNKERTNVKKTISLLLAIGLCFSLLTGCGAAPDPTILWINTTYAAITYVNGGDLQEIGGYKKSKQEAQHVRAGLESSWSVTDYDSAKENMDWLLSEGHRASFNEEMEMLAYNELFDLPAEEQTAILLANDYSEEQALCTIAMMKAYTEKGETAIDAWDYCRALQLLGWYYVADYYTKEEALNQSLEVAKLLQEKYGSWEELMESYLIGYNYYAEDDASDPASATAERRKAYEELKASKNNPYAIAWDTPLTGSWSK